jgi:hypothetical protein
MTGEIGRPADLRYATNEERRYALAYLRWLAGGRGPRGSEPSPGHSTYGLSENRGDQIRADVERMVEDAAQRLAADDG